MDQPKKFQVARDLQGNVITLPDLPAPDTVRWVANRKYIVIKAIEVGLITREEALERYKMQGSELDLWEAEFKEYGARGLKTTHFQRRRGKSPSM